MSKRTEKADRIGRRCRTKMVKLVRKSQNPDSGGFARNGNTEKGLQMLGKDQERDTECNQEKMLGKYGKGWPRNV